MSKTNAQVQEAFGQGETATNNRQSLRSEANREDGITFLLSYGTTIAIRQAETEQTFWDGHTYSPTTSQHQGGHYGAPSPSFSFKCVAQLMGPRWYEAARIVDWGPRDCTDPDCERERAQQWAMYRAEITLWYDDISSRCWASEEERMRVPNLHTVALPEYDDGKRWKAPAVLLEFKRGGQYTYVLCGFEQGKNLKYFGRTDQLWAAILPVRPMNIERAFDALKPPYVKNAERHNENMAKGDIRDNPPPAVAIRRQGDLYFVQCANGEGPPKEAIKMDGVALPPGDRANHQPNQLRMVCGPSVAASWEHTGSLAANGKEWLFWARGNVDHPEHPRLRLGAWHRVLCSAAVRGASAAYRDYRGSGSAAGGD